MEISGIFNKFKNHEFGKTLLHFKNYFIGSIATKALAFISIPVLTRLLSPNDYGIVSVYLSYIGIFVIVFSLNTSASVSRYFFEEKNDYKAFFGTSIILSFTVLFIFFISSFFFKDVVLSWLEIPEILYYFIFLSVLFSIISSFFQQNFVALRMSKKIAITSVLQSYIGFGISVVIILLLKKSLYLGPILGNILMGFVFSIYFVIQLKPYVKFSFSVSHLKYILNFSVPLIPYALGSVILAQFDRIMINSYNGNSDAGLYSFAYNIGMLLSVFIGALFQSWVPNFYKYMNKRNYDKRDEDINKMFRLILFAALFLIYFGAEIGLLLADKSFHSAVKVIPVVVFGYIFFSIFYIYGTYAGYVNKTYYSSIVLIISGVINIYLNVLFIPEYGYIASAYTTIVSYLVMAVLSWLVCKFIFKLDITPFRILVFPFVILCTFILIPYLFNLLFASYWMLIILKGILLFGFVFILFYKNIKKIFD